MLKNSKEPLLFLVFNKKKIASIQRFDFSTLYTTIPRQN
jgi:hypothetical protein